MHRFLFRAAHVLSVVGGTFPLFEPPRNNIKRVEPYLYGADIHNPGLTNIAHGDVSDLPTHVDWRSVGAVTSVDNQRNCGSCFCFGTIASVEAAIQMKYGTLVKLSAQEILACNSRKMSCAGGGRTEYAFEYIKEHGIGLAKDYPYKARSWPCLTCKKNNKKYKRYRIKRYERVTCSHDGDESHLQRAVARQPITASIKVGKKFSKFKGGIWNEEEPFGIGHAVCVVGYGVYKNLQVWICKNSYGRNWGNSGYFYVQRKTDRKYGRSGILKKCYYPIVEEVYDESDECGGHDFSNKASPADPTRTLVDSETSTVTPSGLMSYFCGEPDALAYGKVLRMEGMLVDEYGRCEDPIREMEGIIVDEYGRCEDPIREMEGMLVDEYGSNASTIQLAGLLSSHIYDFSNNVSPADPTRTLVDSETSTVTPSGLMSYFCGEPDALAYGKVTMSLSHLIKSRLAFSTLLNQEGGIFSAFYKATRVLQRSLAPEIGGKKGSCFPNIHTTSQSSPMQAYNHSINDLDKELDHLKSGFEVLRMEGMLVDEYGRCEDPIREMEGIIVDEYGRCEDPIREMGGMLVDEYGSNTSTIQLAGLLSSHIYDFSNNVSPADPTRTVVDSETSTVTPSGLMSYFCGEPDALAYGKVTMSLSHLIKSRLAFSTLLNQEGGIFSAFYKATRVLQRSLAPEIGGKKGSCFPNIHTTSQSSPMQAYNHSINDLDKELDHLKSGFEVTMSFSHHLKSRLAFSTLLNQEGGIFSAFYKATRVLQRSLGPEIGGKKGSCFPNIHTTSQSSPMQAYNHSINDLDKELDHLKSGFEVLRMEGMLVDEYGRCEDPIREMEGMLVDEYGRRSC